jgi:seryl-tRNA synthetase
MLAGCNDAEAQVELDGDVLTYKKLDDNLEARKKELKELVDEKIESTRELDAIDEEIDGLREEIEEAIAIYNKREEINKELKTKEDSLKDLDEKISEKESELASITGQLKEVGEEPIILSAGHFVVGSDLPPGRYIAEPNRGRGNFFVRTDGRSKVAVTLGDRDSNESEYVFFADEGETMELNTSVKFTKVE